jgi:hypothetical protein
MEGISLHCIYIFNLLLCQGIRASDVGECKCSCMLNGEYLDQRDMKLNETGEHCIIRRVIRLLFINYYLVDDIWKMMCMGNGELRAEKSNARIFWWENL